MTMDRAHALLCVVALTGMLGCGGGSEGPADADAAVTVDASRPDARMADAGAPRVTLTVRPRGNGSATPMFSPAGTFDCGDNCFSFPEGTTVHVVAVPDPGSRVVGWGRAGCEAAAACDVRLDVAVEIDLTAIRVMGTTIVPGSAAAPAEILEGVAADAAGNIVVVGDRAVAGGSSASFVRKLAPDGSEIWTRTNDGSGRDSLQDVAIDRDGAIVVVGFSEVAGQQDDILIQKWSADGAALWTRSHDGAFHGIDQAFGVATDAQSNVVVAGVVEVSGSGYFEIWVAKYDSSGTQLWTRTVANAGSDTGTGVAVAPDGSILVAAHLARGAAPDVWYRKYSPDGMEVWTRTYGSPSGAWDYARSVEVDQSGSFYVVGAATDGVERVWVRKCGANGDEVWTSWHKGGAGYSLGLGTDLAPDGTLVVSGARQVSGLIEEAVMLRYDDKGGVLAEEVYRSAAGTTARGNDIVVDGRDTVFVVGYEAGHPGTMPPDAKPWVRRFTPSP